MTWTIDGTVRQALVYAPAKAGRGKVPLVFAFHGYQYAVHQIVHRRPNPARFHVRGFNEQGTTTTPFDMVVLNKMSRYHLASRAVEHSSLPRDRAAALMTDLNQRERDAVRYTREFLEDRPEERDWTWSSEA